MIHNSSNLFTKTKILATLGPATHTAELIKKMISAGVDGVRLNFSHGDHQFYSKIFGEIHSACVDENTPLAVLIDLQGPKMRIGELIQPEIEIVSGERIEITTQEIFGTEKIISTSYQSLADDAQTGDLILIDDGLIRLRIIEKKENSVLCEIEAGGILKPRKGMNLPGMRLSTPSITVKDYTDIKFALEHHVDFIALSFVRTADDILKLKQWLKNYGKEKPVIAKIEKKEAIDDFDQILKVSDGIMIARGDLGVELSPQEVPIVQKKIIRECNAVGKLVITATQMLESMINNPIPTRAEASDVANAVLDGTDAVMLSGETSIGKYPLRAVQIMNDVIKRIEQQLPERSFTDYVIPDSIEENLFDSVGKAIASISQQTKASTIVVFTFQGRTARNLSKFRPESKIIAVSNSFDTMNNLCLYRGVTSIFMEDIIKENAAVDKVKKLIVDAGLVNEGEIILFAAGAPYSEKSRANWLRFEAV